MSSFFDQSSLCLIPSGYKDGKVYSVKPTSGAGDLTFTRNSNATRVDADGLVEKVRTNSLLQSNQFDTTWLNSLSTETSGQEGYNGTNDAWLLTATSTGGFIYQDIAIGGINTFSVYAKAGSQNGITLYSAHASQGRYFNLSTGAIGGIFVGTPIASSIDTVGGGWYRCSITVSATSTNNFRAYVSNGTANVAGNIYIQDAQLEQGLVPTSYIETTTTAMSEFAGVTASSVADVPRLDYSGDCPSLLLEPQRTNNITSSENISTGWTYTNTAVSINQTTSPDGYANADAIVPDATSGQHAINSSNISSSGSFTLSAFVKAGELNKVAIRESNATGAYASFDLSTGTKIEDNVSGDAFIEAFSNGWYRIGVTYTYSGNIRLGINVLSNAYTTGNPSSGATYWSSNGTDKLYVYGMQCEAGSYPTSYIPTYGTTVTRLAEACSKTGISSLIGQTEGTLFVEAEYIDGVNDARVSLSDGTTNNWIFIGAPEPTGGLIKMRMYINASGVNQVNKFSSTVVTKGVHKYAMAYKANDVVMYLDGQNEGSDTLATIPACSRFDITGGSPSSPNALISEGIKQVILFPTRLTNAQLAELTSL